ncbi:hypothetical protein GOP47_0011528 [Adiantum capillus-veneris]|uniref:J domain-containing protein n=1 Tax=Adiantum capillus-veneris TaxID=13818 RepID=A0A9D4USY9_ADICA|nr:hypothetical protein GOP47_0011528 [Adiantum capillus-veneris]
MSLLLGVRGSDQKNEGQSFRENIIQQPGSFYNGNPSSSIWGNPPLQPLWCELPLADEILSSSSSTAAVPSMSSTSSAFKNSIGMAEEKHWQDTTKSDAVRGEGVTLSRAEAYGYLRANIQQNGKLSNTYRTSDPPSSPFTFGYSPQQALFGNDGMNSLAFSSRDSSQEILKNGKPALDEGGRRADMEPSFSRFNEKSWKVGMSDVEGKSSLRSSSLNSSTMQQNSTLEGKMRVLENESIFHPDGNNSICSDATDSKHAFAEKKTPDVFVFGASGLGGSSFKSSAPQQKLFQGSFAATSARSRTGKFKRHSNVLKGKGLAPLGGVGIQQVAPAFSRDASPQSNTGMDSATESSQLDEAECSDAGIWPEDNIDVSIDFDADEPLQSEGMREDGSGAAMQNKRLSSAEELNTDNEGSILHFNPNWQAHVSSSQKPQEDYPSQAQETQHGTNWQTLDSRFSSWWPFKSKSEVKSEVDSSENWEADGSSKTSKEKYTSDHLIDAVDEPNTTVEQEDLSDLNLSSTYAKLSDSNLQSPSGGFAEVSERSDGKSPNLKFAGKFLVKEPTQNTGGNVIDSVWSLGGKDPSQPFVFGAAQQQADYTTEGIFGRSGTMVSDKKLKDERLQENYEGFTAGSSAPIASGLSLLSASFSSGTISGSPVYKGQASTDSQPSSHSSVFVTSKPVAKVTNNLHISEGAQLSSFTKHEKEGPTGEFSGPLSRSESSASEGSPSSGEPFVASDKSSNQTQCFEFQGNVKDGTNTQMVTGKKKSRTNVKVRRQVRGLNRPRRATQSASFQNMNTPMDFSPIANDTELSSGATTLEQPYFNFGGTDIMDDRELLRQLSEIQNMSEFTAADEDIRDFQGGKQVFEGANEWAEHSLFSSRRSGKWKRRGLDEGHSSSPYQEAEGSAEHLEREDTSAFDDYSLKQEASNYEPPFTFGASSSYTAASSMHHRYAQRPQKEKSTEILEDLTADSTTVCTPDGSIDLAQDRQSQLKSGPCLSFPVTSVDKSFQSGASKTSISNQNHSYVKSTEESTPAITDFSQHFVPAISGSPNAVKSAAAEQVCERWRLRGNQAYANGDFPKAEEYYSRGASSVSPDETSQSCIRASMLCYSNRAATRMAVGRMREALADCKRAMVVDPGFLRVRLRAASCHLALGESKAAADTFKECLKYAKESAKPDTKILVEAMEGVKKSQQLDGYSDRAFILLQKQTFMDSTSALRLLNEALSISSFSEPLHELKAQVLLSLRRYEECLQFCEQTLPTAERNHGSAVHERYQDSYLKEGCQINENGHLKLWRWRLSAKALHHLGKLEDSLELLVKHEEVVSGFPADKGTNSESLAPFLANIRDLLRHKAAGNEAFQLGKHAEAVEHYTAALACNGDSRPFNAVCFCNRAAASQALGHIADAISDCSRAIALDAVYPKALSRRATLHEMIRDYGQACNDLRRLIALLEDKNNETSKGVSANVNAQDLRQAKERLEKGEEEMKKGHPIDHYLILGVDFSCSANEIKKAYRKAALKHHPDKAGQFLARSEIADDGSLWKEVGDEVRRDAERLFKLIGEAYAILSDATKRLRYDMEEENRKLRGKDGNNQVTSSTSEGYRSQYEKSGRRQRDRWDAWQGYVPQHQRWQSGPDAAQPDTYGRRSTQGADPAKTGKATWNFSWDKL